MKVIDKIGHPDYDNLNLKNDIAILHLNRRARLSGIYAQFIENCKKYTKASRKTDLGLTMF